MENFGVGDCANYKALLVDAFSMLHLKVLILFLYTESFISYLCIKLLQDFVLGLSCSSYLSVQLFEDTYLLLWFQFIALF